MQLEIVNFNIFTVSSKIEPHLQSHTNIKTIRRGNKSLNELKENDIWNDLSFVLNSGESCISITCVVD